MRRKEDTTADPPVEREIRLKTRPGSGGSERKEDPSVSTRPERVLGKVSMTLEAVRGQALLAGEPRPLSRSGECEDQSDLSPGIVRWGSTRILVPERGTAVDAASLSELEGNEGCGQAEKNNESDI